MALIDYKENTLFLHILLSLTFPTPRKEKVKVITFSVPTHFLKSFLYRIGSEWLATQGNASDLCT